MPKTPTIADTLRAAIADSGLSAYRLARRAGVPAPTITRFLRGERDVSLSSADKLARILGLELRPTKAAQQRRDDR